MASPISLLNTALKKGARFQCRGRAQHRGNSRAQEKRTEVKVWCNYAVVLPKKSRNENRDKGLRQLHNNTAEEMRTKGVFWRDKRRKWLATGSEELSRLPVCAPK